MDAGQPRQVDLLLCLLESLSSAVRSHDRLTCTSRVVWAAFSSHPRPASYAKKSKHHVFFARGSCAIQDSSRFAKREGESMSYDRGDSSAGNAVSMGMKL